MNAAEFVQAMANRTRVWRAHAVESIRESNRIDFSYRPKSGMSSIGWLLAHQAAVYDFSLNMVVLGGLPKNSHLLSQYVPGTSGDWSGQSEDEIERYYTSGEADLLEWVRSASDSDLDRVLEGKHIPATFHGMRVIDFIANMFVHLNHHNGHLNVILNEIKAELE